MKYVNNMKDQKKLKVINELNDMTKQQIHFVFYIQWRALFQNLLEGKWNTSTSTKNTMLIRFKCLSYIIITNLEKMIYTAAAFSVISLTLQYKD